MNGGFRAISEIGEEPASPAHLERQAPALRLWHRPLIQCLALTQSNTAETQVSDARLGLLRPSLYGSQPDHRRRRPGLGVSSSVSTSSSSELSFPLSPLYPPSFRVQMLGLLTSRFLRTFICCALVLLVRTATTLPDLYCQLVLQLTCPGGVIPPSIPQLPATYLFFIPPPAPSPEDAVLTGKAGHDGWLYAGSSSTMAGVDPSSEDTMVGLGSVTADVLGGGAIMGHLGNETAKCVSF